MNEELKEKLKFKIAISQMKEKEKMAMNKEKRRISKGIGIAACLVVATTGIVFAKDISNQIYNKYFTGKGVEKAINEGYIENTEMEEQSSDSTIQDEETGKIIEDNETSKKGYLIDLNNSFLYTYLRIDQGGN